MKQEKSGITIEKMEREQTTIRLPAELKERLQQEADRSGITVHDLVIFILWRYLKCIVPK